MDVQILDSGSVVLVRPVTPTAKAWVDEFVQLEGWQWMGDAFAVEPRYVADLAEGMANDGLRVSA